MASKSRASDKSDCTTTAAPVEAAPAQRVLVAVESKVAEIESVTVGFTPIESESRADTGKGFFPVADALVALVTVLAEPPDDPALRRKWERMVRAFDVLGDSDDGVDPERFEVERVAASIDEVQRMQRVADRLERVARLCRDQALVTAEGLSRTGVLAIDLARTLAKGEFGAQLVPVTDVLKARTAEARRVGPKPAPEKPSADEKKDSDQ